MSLKTRLQQLGLWISTRGEAGSSVVEYALLVTLIAVVCLMALKYVGHSADVQYSNIAAKVAAAN